MVAVKKAGAGRSLLVAGVLAACSLAAYPTALLLLRAVDGMPGAVLFMATLATGVVAVGVSVSILISMRPLRSGRRRSPREARCRFCKGAREIRADVWICLRCDQSAAMSQPS